MILLLDSASLWYRAFYGMPDSLRSPSGAPVNAIRGFIDSVARLATTYKPKQIIACLDGDWRPSWRTELLPEYKTARTTSVTDVEKRAQEEIDLEAQVPVILGLFDSIGLPVIGIDDYEADDVIATLTSREKSAIVIATGDRDLFQLVDDAKPVQVAYLAKGISSHELVDLKWITQRYGIPGERYALMALLRGDPSDGLPGVRGIGEKGAAAIVNHFGTVAEIIAAAQANDARLTKALVRKILDGRDYLKRAEPVINCVRTLRLPQLPSELPRRVVDRKKLDELVTEFGLATSVGRLLSALSLE
jgi:5'-3' exonuclease